MAIIDDILGLIVQYQSHGGSLDGCRLLLSPARYAALASAMAPYCAMPCEPQPLRVAGLPVEMAETVEDLLVWAPSTFRARWVLLPSGMERRTSRIPLAPPDREGLTVAKLQQLRETFFSSMDARTEDASFFTPAEVAERLACMHGWFASVAPASPLSGSGYYGQSCPREIPDTPLDEWNAGVEALLAACETWQRQTDEVLDGS